MEDSKICIKLDSPTLSYSAGQIITGRVILNNVKPITFKNISISFEGNGKVKWGDIQHRQTGSFGSEENYLRETIMIFENNHESVTPPIGTVSFPFEFRLPLNLPSTFTGVSGRINYEMKARLKPTGNKTALECYLPFSVNGILDLNCEPGVAKSVCYEKHNNFSLPFCKSGPVIYKITLPRTGFVPGEFIELDADFLNNSPRKITGVKLTLVQMVTFSAASFSNRSRKLWENVTKIKSPSIPSGEKYKWKGEILRVPQLAPSKLAPCKIICVQYFLKFVVKMSGIKNNITETIPIMIGTVPLRNTFMNVASGQSAFPDSRVILSLPTGRMEPSAPVFDIYHDLALPSYVDAIHGGHMHYDPIGERNCRNNSELALTDGDDNQDIDDLPGYDYLRLK